MRSEAIVRAEELFERSCDQGVPVTVAELLDASGLIEQLTEADELCDDLGDDLRTWADTSPAALFRYDEYRTRYPRGTSA